MLAPNLVREIDWTPHRDVIFSKTFVFIYPHEYIETGYSKISTLESDFETVRFRWLFSLDTCGR